MSDLSPCNCPACGYPLKTATPVEDGSTPSPGDFSLCINCAAILMFGPNLQIIMAPDTAIRALRDDSPRDFAVLHAAHHHIIQRGPFWKPT